MEERQTKNDGLSHDGKDDRKLEFIKRLDSTGGRVGFRSGRGGAAILKAEGWHSDGF
jgi:hypothetical protein